MSPSTGGLTGLVELNWSVRLSPLPPNGYSSDVRVETIILGSEQGWAFQKPGVNTTKRKAAVCHLMDDLVKSTMPFQPKWKLTLKARRFLVLTVTGDLLTTFIWDLNLYCLLSISICFWLFSASLVSSKTVIILSGFSSVLCRRSSLLLKPPCLTIHTIWEMPCRFDVNSTSLGLHPACVKTTCRTSGHNCH